MNQLPETGSQGLDPSERLPKKTAAALCLSVTPTTSHIMATHLYRKQLQLDNATTDDEASAV